MCVVHFGFIIFTLLFHARYLEAQESKDINMYMPLVASNSFVPSTDSSDLSTVECASLCSQDENCCNFHHRRDTGQCLVGQQNECIGPQSTVIGWTYFRRGKEFNGKFYMFIALPKSWNDAKTECQNLGMTLASIENEETDIFLKNIVAIEYGKAIWLGGNDIAWEGVWVWEGTGTRFTYTNWWQHSYQPNQGTVANCLCYYQYSDRPGFQWADEECYKYYHFVCEKPIN